MDPNQTAAQNLSGTFDNVLASFGTGVPQISTIVTVVLGSIGFDKYFNAGAWAIFSILCFGIVSFYRRQIPSSLLRTTAWAVAFVIIFGGLAIYQALSLGSAQGVTAWIEANKALATVYMSILFTLPLASLIISYQKQEEAEGLNLPVVLEEAVKDQLYRHPFYKSNVFYVLKITEVDAEGLVVVNEMSYKVKNRTGSRQEWKMHYRLSDVRGRIDQVKCNDTIIQSSAFNYSIDNDAIGRNVFIPVRLGPGDEASVYFRVTQKYRHSDGELYTSYTPATDLAVRVENIPDGFYFELDPLHYQEEQRKESGKTKEIFLSRGVLPYQGVRVSWRRINHEQDI